MTNEILTQLRSALVFVQEDRERREKYCVSSYIKAGRDAESALNAAIAGVDGLEDVRARYANLQISFIAIKAERDAAIAERDCAVKAAHTAMNFHDEAIAERDAAVSGVERMTAEADKCAEIMSESYQSEMLGLIKERDATIAERDGLARALLAISKLDYRNAATNCAAFSAVEIARAALTKDATND